MHSAAINNLIDQRESRPTVGPESGCFGKQASKEKGQGFDLSRFSRGPHQSMIGGKNKTKKTRLSIEFLIIISSSFCALVLVHFIGYQGDHSASGKVEDLNMSP